MSNYTEAIETAHASGRSSGHLESPSHGKVPKWLEDMTDNVRRNRPRSWRLSRESPLENVDLSPPNNGVISLLENLSIDQDQLPSDEELLALPRNGSARHGRRAVSSIGTRSAGNSPRKSSQQMMGEDWKDISVPSNIAKRELLNARQRFSSRNSSAASSNSREGREPSLEESWSSLSFFDRRHKGRLTEKAEDELTSSPIGSDPLNGSLSPAGDTDDSGGTHSMNSSDSDFIIPELPSGSKMELNIHSTWGDRHYLGLNGIEVFSSTGEPVTIAKIWADPADINVLPEYSKDPRVITNLLDGVNRTHDDMHLWLAPFTKGANHYIYLIFKHKVQVAMIRIWNYNKSRIHSYRGARDVEITLDGVTIFRGEIARACGGILGGTEAFGDTILFTTDDTILELISQYDESFYSLLSEVHQDIDNYHVERPITADNGDERPFTCARTLPDSSSALDSCSGILLGGQKLEITLMANWGHPALIGLTGLEVLGDGGSIIPVEPHFLQCSVLSPDIYRIVDGVNVTTDEDHMWSTPFLDGDEIVLTINFPVIVYIAAIRVWNHNCTPDLSYCGVKLVMVHFDGKLVSPGLKGLLTLRRAPGNCHFNFAQDLNLLEEPPYSHQSSMHVDQAYYSMSQPSSSLHVGDSSYEDPLSSPVEHPLVKLSPPHGSGDADEERLSPYPHIYPSVTIRGVGDDEYVPLRRNSLLAASPRAGSGVMVGDEEYESPVMPQGFVFQLLILSTWGDPYYVGLNGLELYDQDGDKIRLTENNIGAFPDSVNVLEGVSCDVRTPEKLVDGVNDTLDGRHMWLAPILPNQLNRVYIVFDYPVTVSMIKLWNYGKTPSRGVKEFGILVDDLLVYNGVLDKVSSVPKTSVKVPYRTVLFTTDKELLRRERSTQVRNSSYGHDVKLLNDHKRVTSGGSCLSADQSQRPLTSLVPTTRSRSLYNL
ncbi:katanin-interacting protein-like [Periplaneta americana]|uniref:katanin-interacting protein-like n=1 Tax=Periplaneta americana TaxID=6978 RepID=UPI0037E93DB8